MKWSFDHRVVRRILPHRGAMLLLDRVTSYAPTERSVIGVKTISQGDPLAQAYLPGRAVFPPVLVVEALAQTCGFMMNLEYLARCGFDLSRLELARDGDLHVPHSVLADSKVRHRSLAASGEEVKLTARILLQRREMYLFRVQAMVAGREVAGGDITLAYPTFA
jgi:3-hydroxyacyl-[acyl-carrier-protein] dehydratase